MTAVLLSDLDQLVSALRSAGRRVIAPTVRDGAIVLSEVDSAAELPHGWGVEVEAGRYRLRRRNDEAAFAHSSGPQSWKTWLHPARERLWSARRDGTEVTVTEDDPVEPMAFLGVRPCDLRAIAVLDRVLGASTRYAQRRAAVFIVAVNCTEPGATCFCVSAGGGPAAESGYDIVLTELDDGRYLADAGSRAGTDVLAGLASTPAEPAVAEAARTAVDAAATRMGRTLPEADLRDLLGRAAESPHWDDVASRCLTCGNCTMVCPTCFCTTVEDTTDLTGAVAERWQRWDSCFDIGYSQLHSGPVRASGASRYRQWLTHKLGTWHDQFGESGCVGCGRCITWCPVGIDITAELSELAMSP